MLILPPDRAGFPAQGPSRRFPLNSILKSTKQWFQGKNLLALGILVASLLLVACDANAKQSTFGTAGPVAEKQLLLFNVLLWVMVVVFILVEGALLYAAIRFRRRPGQPLPKQTHGNTVLEITWTVIPTILILGLGVWSVITLFEIDKPPASAADNILDVTVTGHQWWWEFEYPDADGNGTVITTANELRVPVGRAVEVLLQSDDVIHSFWIPKLAGKVDVVPTRNNRLWFLADEVGTFYGQCAEFCGIAHAQMKFQVEVLSQEEYDAWVAGYGQEPQLSAEAQQGKALFATCSSCHTSTGVDDPVVVDARQTAFLNGEPRVPAPNLTDFATRQTFAAGLAEVNRENLRIWLNNPDDIKPGNRMGELAAIYSDGEIVFSQQDVSALIEYLLSLK